MALTGEVSDLSLGELIEFFCNQRKTGRLKLIYPSGPAYFYLQSGSVVHARIGDLRGIEAVYYALTLPNASFNFSPAFEAPEQTINQPWTSVVLEGLRRMDEGIKPRNPFPVAANEVEKAKSADAGAQPKLVAAEKVTQVPFVPRSDSAAKPEKEAFFAHTVGAAQGASRPWNVPLVAGALVLILAAIGLPWGWYARSKARAASQAAALQTQTAAPVPETPPAATVETAASEVAPAPVPQDSPATAEADLAAKRQREARARERTRAAEAAATLNPSSTVKPQPAANPGAKRVTVQVTYDENGRVTQATGGDPTALRIARQKRFPAGKPGSATVTIPIN